MNVFQKLREMLPLPAVLVGTVVEHHEDDTSSVLLPTGLGQSEVGGSISTGSLIRARGRTVPVGQKAFVRAGVIETRAPDGDPIDLPIGKVVDVAPPPPAPAPPPAAAAYVKDTFTGEAGTSVVGAYNGEVGADWSLSPDGDSATFELDGSGGMVMSGAFVGSKAYLVPSGSVPADTPFYIELDMTPLTPGTEGWDWFFSISATPDGSDPASGWLMEFNSNGGGAVWLDTWVASGEIAELALDVRKVVRLEFASGGALTVKVDGEVVRTDTYEGQPAGKIVLGIEDDNPAGPNPIIFHGIEIGSLGAGGGGTGGATIGATRVSGMCIGNRNNSKAYYNTEAFWDEAARIGHIVVGMHRGFLGGPTGQQAVIRQLKARNPDMRVFMYTNVIEGNINATGQYDSANDVTTKLTEMNWWLKTVAGAYLPSKIQAGRWDVNILDYAATDSDGKRITQWLAARDNGLYWSKIPELDGWYFDNINWRSRQTVAANWRYDGVNVVGGGLAEGHELSVKWREGLRDWVDAAAALQPAVHRMGNADHDLSNAELSGAFHSAFIESAIGKDWSIETWGGWEGLWDRYSTMQENVIDPAQVVLNVYSSDANVVRYALCTVLLGEGKLCVTDPAQEYSTVPWYPEYDIELGDPDGDVVVDGTVRMRQYEGGLVLVNTSKTSAASVETSYGTILMSPRSGQILT